MEQRPGGQPSRAQKKVEAQPEILNQTVSGRGRVLLIREFLRQEESYTTLQNFPGQPSKDPNPEPTYSQTTGCQGSSSSARWGLKRTGDPLADSPEAPPAKSKHQAEKREKTAQKPEKRAEKQKLEKQQLSELKEEELPDCEAPRDLPKAPSSETAEITELGSESGKQLLLVLCHASALSTQLPRLQLLLQQVRVHDRRPPAALVGILVHPRPDEEAESRRRLEELLCSVFASESPGVEVHTAVFCPSRAQGVLNVQRAGSQAHMNPLVDRQTQTDGAPASTIFTFSEDLKQAFTLDKKPCFGGLSIKLDTAFSECLPGIYKYTHLPPQSL
ncbi:hypothetical protein STEG23_009641 [Scotinomys teguina]